MEKKTGGFKATDLMHHHSTWDKAVEKNEGVCTGSIPKLVAFLRLFGWHLLLPIFYFVAFPQLFDQIDPWQSYFGLVVLLRQVIYALTAVVCLNVNPAYLLVDIWASFRQEDVIHVWEGGSAFVLLYIFAPDKYVIFALFDEGGLKTKHMLSLVCSSMVLDLVSSIGALVCGIYSGALPMELAIVYMSVALSGIGMTTAFGELNLFTELLILIFAGTFIAFCYTDRWIWCNSETCQEKVYPGMPTDWTPPNTVGNTTQHGGFWLL